MEATLLTVACRFTPRCGTLCGPTRIAEDFVRAKAERRVSFHLFDANFDSATVTTPAADSTLPRAPVCGNAFAETASASPPASSHFTGTFARPATDSVATSARARSYNSTSRETFTDNERTRFG